MAKIFLSFLIGLTSLVTFGQDSVLSVNFFDLIEINGLKYLQTDKTKPYTGEAVHMNSEGVIESKVKYFKGRLHGNVENWTNTKLTSVYYYENGMLSGKFIEWDSLGNLKTEGKYYEDLRDGIWFFYVNGIKFSSGRYQKGKKSGAWFFYDSRGHVIGQEFYDDNGNLYRKID